MWPNSVNKKDLIISFYRGSGAGGQHRNKTDSACRIKHIPTGIFSTCESHKSQAQNKKEAFKRLSEKLIPLMCREEAKERYKFTDRIRTYNQKTSIVIDHRTNKSYEFSKFLAGDYIESIRKDLLTTKK